MNKLSIPAELNHFFESYARKSTHSPFIVLFIQNFCFFPGPNRLQHHQSPRRASFLAPLSTATHPGTRPNCADPSKNLACANTATSVSSRTVSVNWEVWRVIRSTRPSSVEHITQVGIHDSIDKAQISLNLKIGDL